MIKGPYNINFIISNRGHLQELCKAGQHKVTPLNTSLHFVLHAIKLIMMSTPEAMINKE